MRMRLNFVLIKFLLLISLFEFTVQHDKKNETLFDEIKNELSELGAKINNQFSKFKEHVNELFSREKRQNFDPAFAASFNNLKTNMGFRSGLQSSPNARVIDKVASAALRVSQNIASRVNTDSVSGNVDRSKNIANANARSNIKVAVDRISTLQAPKEFCPFKNVGNCDSTTPFRTFDGSCNNLQNPWWGKSETPYKRYLQAEYSDGIQQPRMFAKSGNELPNPRLITRTICMDNSQTEVMYSHILPLFGQFLAHDITSVSSSTDDRGMIVDCPCGSPNPECLSIVIPEGEKIMTSKCLKFTRSSAAFPTFDCRLGVREQLNIISSFIDGTPIYGTDSNRNLQLRTLVGGQLKSAPGTNNRPFLSQGVDGACRDTNERVKCFVAGEGRTNENLGLASVQTLFMRAHNNIALQLSKINPRWNDETLFQETRRIVLAILQHIVYNEYLTALLGWNTATLFDLVPLVTDTYYTGYDQDVNPSMANEFTTAAYRFGHTLIRNVLSRSSPNSQKVGDVGLDKIIFRPVEAYNSAAGGLESILFGMLNDAAGKYDVSFADTLLNHLFEFKLPDGTSIAIDLTASNINRGRDHGIPSYNAYRERCGFRRANTFSDLSDTISQQQIQALSLIYESPDDIDLYIGGLSEQPSVGALVGPVFGCLIASQFSDLKKGDRFYYENGPSETAFTLDQLHEIRKMSLSRLICDNTDITQIQPNAFLLPLPSINNGRTSCESLPIMDLRAWASN